MRKKVFPLLILFILPTVFGATIELNAGWNLVSTHANGLGVEQINENCVREGGPWAWSTENQEFVFEEEMKTYKGYWVKVENSCSFSFKGSPPDQNSVTLNQGWNLVSSAYENWGLKEINENCDRKGGPWKDKSSGWSWHQEPLDSLKGYWVKVGSECNIDMSNQNYSDSEEGSGDADSNDEETTEESSNSSTEENIESRFSWKILTPDTLDRSFYTDQKYDLKFKAEDRQNNVPSDVVVEVWERKKISGSWSAWNPGSKTQECFEEYCTIEDGFRPWEEQLEGESGSYQVKTNISYNDEVESKKWSLDFKNPEYRVRWKDFPDSISSGDEVEFSAEAFTENGNIRYDALSVFQIEPEKRRIGNTLCGDENRCEVSETYTADSSGQYSFQAKLMRDSEVIAVSPKNSYSVQ